MFLSIWGPKMAPRPKGILIIFGYFLDIFRYFSLSRLFQRFWLISHAQDDQEQRKSMENSMEKDDQNPSQGLPKGSKSPLYGRAVAPALPAQLIILIIANLEKIKQMILENFDFLGIFGKNWIFIIYYC